MLMYLLGNVRRGVVLLNLPENTKSIHVFNENISFPVFIYVRDEWERVQVSYLNQNIANGNFTTLEIGQWCKNHQINFQILFPENKLKLLFKDPKRFLCYLYIRKQGF